VILIISVLFLHTYFCSATSIMLKQVTTSILLLAFMASSFCRAVIVMDYYTNTPVYAKNCENKARPKMHCNGKCQMMKKLQQQDKQDQGNSERKAANKNEVVSSKSFFTTTFIFQSPPARYYAIPVVQHPVDRVYDFFHPPCAV
jgi:hypothetical protein